MSNLTLKQPCCHLRRHWQQLQAAICGPFADWVNHCGKLAANVTVAACRLGLQPETAIKNVCMLASQQHLDDIAMPKIYSATMRRPLVLGPAAALGQACHTCEEHHRNTQGYPEWVAYTCLETFHALWGVATSSSFAIFGSCSRYLVQQAQH